LNRGSQV